MVATDDRVLRHWGFAAVVVLHLLVFWGLLQTKLIQRPVPLTTLTVDLIQPPAEVRPPEPPPPPKPRPMSKRIEPVQPPPVQPPVQLAAPQAPSPAVVPSPPPLPVVAPLSPVVPPAPPAPPAPVDIVKPRFDADYLDNPKPVYPPLSRRMGEEGRVVLRVQVGANGLPTEVAVQATSGSGRLDRAALDAVRRWTFVPARRGDEAVAASVLVPIAFSLKE